MQNHHLSVTAILALCAFSCKAQPGLKTTEVFMYKNGYTYVHKAGSVLLTNGNYLISEKDIPPAVFGSIWLQSPQKVKSVLRFADTTMITVYTPSVEQMLKQSKGKKVKLSISSAAGIETIEGTVVKVWDPPFGKPTGNYLNPAVVSIETASGTVVIFRETLSSVLYATFDNDLPELYGEKVIQPGLKIGFDTKDKSASLDMVYLEQHPAWAPSYRLKLTGDKKAVLNLSAEVSAGNVELSDSKLNLVAGSPEVFGYGAMSRLSGYQEYNYPEYGAKEGYADAVDNRSAWREEPSAVQTGNAADYYIYSLDHIHLQKNETALFNILSLDVDVEHNYRCQLNPVSEYQTVVSSDAQVFPVYHYLEFINHSKQPLTAAPVFVETPYSGGGELLLGQPILNSVPQEGKAEINIAQSLDVPVTQKEEETSRFSNAKTITSGVNQYYFDQVTVSATLHAENQGDEEKVLKIYRQVQGNPLKCDADWKLKVLPSTSGPNSLSEIIWTLKLKPGEKKDIQYSYDYFVRLY